jgi:NAD(P)-dependent dehydrogenase (short-subunit alcohol dehydrogenase family)
MALTVVITGANRGIGLSLCKHYKAQGHTVYGVCRKSNSDLEYVADHVIDGIDISNEQDCHKLFEKLANTKIDLLINNAGILASETLGNLDFGTIEKQFQVNTVGTLRISAGLINNLTENAKIAIITSRMGSISDNTSGRSYGYRMSKAALNAAGKSLAIDLKPDGIYVGIYHPGWVTTDMTSGTGDISPEQSAQRLAKLIEKLDQSNTGTFWHSNGEILPWQKISVIRRRSRDLGEQPAVNFNHLTSYE